MKRLCRAVGAFVWSGLVFGIGSALAADETSHPEGDGWFPLFNGRDLEGWTVKIARHPLGENFADTFRVDEGVIKVSYDRYASFDGQFGHLYTNCAYSHYALRLEYRLTGKPIADAPSWARLNSGVMIHCQSPLSLALEQAFPVSMEFQFLATGATAGRQTGNVCTPGTNLEIGGQLVTAHIIESAARLPAVDEWVAVEVEVHGADEVVHRVDGVEVLRYQRPQLDPRDRDAQRLIAVGVPLALGSGHIALQAEGHPVWFRNIKLRPLGP